MLTKIIRVPAKGYRFVKRQINKNTQSIIIGITNLVGIDLLSLAYKNIGILNFKGHEATGEQFLINQYLHKLIKKNQPIFFDIGANIGEYSTLLRHSFPMAHIFAFEPNKHTFEILNLVAKKENLKAFCVGMSSVKNETEIFFNTDDQKTKLASLNKETLENNYDKQKISSIKINLITLDDFCDENKIDHIDFLKIDTEGHEFDVLKGASKLIYLDKIDIIQFEFNEMNIISRVFLKDFYVVLKNYNIYRLSKNTLIDIKQYKSKNEIFQFQNILAVSKKIDENIHNSIR